MTNASDLLTLDEHWALMGSGPVYERIQSLPRQRRRVCEFLRLHFPQAYTVRQLAKYLGMTPGAVANHLRWLQREDLVSEVDL